jgi:CCR4-NOT transcriptional regulation complex NOT5 subunit
VTTPAKSAKREDKLPLERALRALEDVHKSLKEFSKTDTVSKNEMLNAELKTVRHKAKRLRDRATALASLWDRTFETHS